MAYYRSPYRGEIDREQMLALVHEHPEGHVHVVDLPYRLCSWAFEIPDNVGLWRDGDGRLLAWVILQSPFWKIDYALHPGAPQGIHTDLLEWADEQARRLLGTSSGRPAWFVAVREDDAERRRDLEAKGFASQEAGENPWSQAMLRLDAKVSLPSSPVKDGFRLRALRGEAEVPAYVALHRAVFESPNMTEGWRREILRHPAYRPELDLVIEDSAGDLAAFCIAWLAVLPSALSNRQSIQGQIEPIGVRENCRRHGLAWPILAEAVRRLRNLGAETIWVQTDNYRDRAYFFYQAAGFRVAEHIIVYRKDYEPGN